ncbi:MAG: hypothetical protein HLUCCA01_03665 [Bacteroidetes bacterium HLUCCA01]|nr:MAG: hypothetical protein HLUCCA01_03665 [Bacteroidetes bacterium HLUCCA01]
MGAPVLHGAGRPKSGNIAPGYRLRGNLAAPVHLSRIV